MNFLRKPLWTSARASRLNVGVSCRVLSFGLVLLAAGQTDPAASQTSAASARPVTIILRSEGADRPTSVIGPNGAPFENKGGYFQTLVIPPRSGLSEYDVEVNFGFGSYPLRIRLHPLSTDIQATVAIQRPRSCAEVYLKPLEKPALTPTAALRAAFTLSYLIDGRSGPNSCDRWPLRAAKARFDRYYNAMERSGFLVIPDGVKDALRTAASSERERKIVDQLIANSELAEKQRFAVSLQRSVFASIASGHLADAHATSAMLLETARQPEFAAAIASQISPEALEKQTSDLGERAASDNEALASPQPQ
jgi:hypothetical protein